MFTEIIIEMIKRCRVCANPDPLRSKVVFEEVKQRDPAQSTIRWWRAEKIGDKSASIPDTLPTVLVLQDEGGRIADCSKRHARTRCRSGAKRREGKING